MSSSLADGVLIWVVFVNRLFNNYLEGEFRIFRNRELDYEASIFLRRCTDYYDYASCVCAVAVRSIDDVIVVDKCGADRGEATVFRPMTITAYLNGELTPNTRIIRSRDNKITVSCAVNCCILAVFALLRHPLLT